MTKKSFLAMSALLVIVGCSANGPNHASATAPTVGRVELNSQVLTRSIQYASSEVQSAKVYLLDSSGVAVSSATILADASHYSGGVFSCAIDNVPPGNYKTSVEFYNGADPASSTKIGTGASTDGNGAEAGDFTVTAGQTTGVSIGSVTLDPNPVGNANAAVDVSSATEATITFQ